MEEAKAAVSFAEKTEVFDKALAAESSPRAPTETTPPQASKPFISKATSDKLVADVAEVKAN